MGVTVLGPLAIDGDDAVLAPRDRTVLAALAISPRQAVAPERIADALWAEQPPTTWPKVVQGSISRIRKALGQEAVVTARQGYVLDLPDDAIDSLRFEHLVRRARELLSLDEPDRALFTVTQALDLWYGPPLADLAGWPPGEAAAQRWEELRHDAEELRIEAALASGAWREVLTDAGRLVTDEPYRENRWALLARAQYQAGRQGEALATLQRARAVLAGELGLDPSPELAKVERSILHQDPHLLASVDPTSASFACPYRGLLAYDVDDSEQYFGRDAEVAACLDILTREHVVAVVGTSGSGKSSLVRAGVAASLRRDGRSVAVITPGWRPMAALEQAGGLRPRGVLVVDQLEEVVTLCPEQAERVAFLDALAGHVSAGTDLVLTLRADRLDGLSGHRPFATTLERGFHLLGAMSEDDLRSAIEGPARQAGLLLEPGLVDLLVHEVLGEPGALPLLSHALAQTWERREGRTLTVEGYRASGGIQGAVARSAEQVFVGLDEPDQRKLRALLLRLVVPVSSGQPTRGRIPRRLLASDPSQEDIVEMLVAARLVTSDGEAVELAHESLARAWPRLSGWLDADAEGQLILRHLSTTADSWDAMGRPDSELYRGSRLARALEWKPSAAADLTATERGFLDASEALADAEARAERDRLRAQRRSTVRLRTLLVGTVCLLVTALVAGGLALRESGRADSQAQLASVRELAAASRAVRAEDPELAVLLALEATSPALAGRQPAREAVEALHLAVSSSRLDLVVPDAGGPVAWSPDGRIFATEGPEESGLVEAFDATTGERVVSFEGHDIDVNDVAFGPDGQLATTGDDGALRIWDVEEEKLLAEVTGTGDVWTPSFSTQGPTRVAAIWPRERMIRIATLEPDGSATLLEHPLPDDVDGLVAARLSPDGTWMVGVAGGPPRAVIVEADTLAMRHRLDWDAPPTRAVAISPDGQSVAVGTSTGDVRIHDPVSGQRVHTLEPVPNGNLALAWSPDSRQLAVSTEKGDIQVHAIGESEVAPTMRISASTGGGLYGLAFSPDGTRLLGGDIGVTAARIWDLGPGGGAEVRNVRGAQDAHGVAFGPDGRLFAVGPQDSVLVYDADPQTHEPVQRLRPPASRGTEHGVRALAVSPDGRTVATGHSGGGSLAWNVDRERLLFATPIPGGDVDFRWGPSFSPDGRLVALASESRLDVYGLDGSIEAQLRAGVGSWFRDPVFSPDGDVIAVLRSLTLRGQPLDWEVVWWDWRSDQVRTSPTVIGHNPEFSPDGTRLAIAGVGIETRVLDVATGKRVATLEGHTSGVIDLAYSPDGRHIATAGVDGLTIVWDADDGSQLLKLPAQEHEVSSVAFSPDGRHLATDSLQTDVVRVWTLDVAELRQIAADQVARELTAAECRQYVRRSCDAEA